MENTDNIIEQEKSSPVIRKQPVGLFVLAGILFTALAVIVVLYFFQRGNMIEMEVILTEEKDSLANELVLIMHGYDTLKTNNDSLNAKLEIEQNKIGRLLTINASNTQLIRTYKKEISTMREIMKNYIVQIDSLNTRNKILIAENTQIRQQMTLVEQTNVSLSKEREVLSSKVELASVVQAKNILPQPLNKKRKETDRLSRMVNLMVCFTLRENPIVEAGKKTIFLRVVRPDGLVVTKSPDNIIEVDNETMIFTESRTVDYLNQDVDLCIYVDNNGDFIEGNYTISLYMDNVEIGSSGFILKNR